MANIKKENYVWDIESLLADYNNSVDELFKQWQQKQEEILTVYDSIFEDEKKFANFLKLEDEYEILDNRLMNYITNNYQENLGSDVFMALNQKYTTLSSSFQIQTSDFLNRVIANKVKIRLYLENPKISEYSRYFELMFRQEPHLLSDKEEAIVSQLALPLAGYGDVFSVLCDNDVHFGKVLDSKNQEHIIDNLITGSKFLKDQDRTLRKNTLYNISEAFYNVRHTFCKTLYYNYLTCNKLAQVHKFKDYVENTCFDDEINESLILHIYEQVKHYKPSFEKFYKARKAVLKKVLDLKELEPYDMSMEIAERDGSKFSIPEIKEEVLLALKIMGEPYLKVIKKAFKERWISWLPKPGKQTGAYSIGGIHGLSKYFISMNYDGTMRSLETVIHELGHSVNSYFTNKNQKIYNDEKIFYAEISSITNEVLLSYYLLKKYNTNKRAKLYILDTLISNFFNTTSRQIVFSEFEYIMNQKINQNEPFTTQSVEETYFDLMTKYLDTNPKDKDLYFTDPYHRWTLMTPYRVSHFYTGTFYVYKYAIGQLGAIINAQRIYNDDLKQKERLLTFLQSGTSKSPLDTVKLLGIDLTKDAPWKEAIKIVDSWIKQYYDLAKELKYIK